MTSFNLRRCAAAIGVLLAVALAGNARASITTMHTGYSTAGPQASSADYRSAVEAALATPMEGYGSAHLPRFEDVSNHAIFGSGNSVAYHFTVDFDVTAATAGQWDFRAGVDFGWGGTMLLDDTELAFNPDDQWWAGSWSQGVLSGGLTLAEGRHTLHLYGLEPCCDGYFTTQFSINNGNYTTFADNDGLLPAVPEPANVAMLAAGAGVLCMYGRRRRGRQHHRQQS